MNPTRNSLVTGVGVTLAALAVVYGSRVRNCLDNGQPPTGTNTMGLEASNKQIPEADFYRGLVSLIKEQYVEPITDERKLAIGAVKGMVDSLQDPRSNFMTADEFRAFNDARAGKYEGIGVDLVFDRGNAGATELTDITQYSIPKLKVVAVVPNGPAALQGVKPGDWVESVQNHWVLGPDLIERSRAATQSLSNSATQGLSPAALKARQDSVIQLGRLVKAKFDTMITPAKAKDLLTIGTKGSLSIVWHRGNTLRTTKLDRNLSQVPIVQRQDDVISVRFVEGAADKLKQAISGRSQVTLDLRNNSNGDFDAMKQCLAVVAPAGEYGYLQSEKPGKTKAFNLEVGNSNPPQLTLLVDATTRGAADVFAAALSFKHLATVVGKPSADKSVIELVSLPDGSGYTLVTAEYSTENKTTKTVAIRSDEDETPVAMRELDGTIVAMGKAGGAA